MRMKKNKLGSSDLWISEIGLGCMSLGTNERDAERIIHEALDRGINFMDTADLYDEGRNEEIVGKMIKDRRSDVILATKVGNRRIPGQEGWVWDASKGYIKSAVKDSLQRLQTDYIDLYQLHGGTLDDPIEETIEAFEELKKEGIIRYYGISSIRPNVIREYVKRSGMVSVMSQYSILDRRPEEEVLPLLAEHGISVIARGPVASGVLAEKGASKVQKGYLDYGLDELLEIRGELQSLVHESRSMAQTAIRYVLTDHTVASAIAGASTLEQLIHNTGAGELPDLTPEEVAMIRNISRANQYTAHR